MKRFALILAAVAATAFGPVAVSLAHADDQGRGRAHAERQGDRQQGGGRWERQERGGGPPRAYGERYAPPPPRGPYEEDRGRYVEDPRRGRYVDERRAPPPRERDDGRGRWAEPTPYSRGYPGYPAPYPRAPGVRPGGYLPPSYRGASPEDYRRYRLRPPPRGYSWVRVGDGFALVSPDGQIFDIVR